MTKKIRFKQQQQQKFLAMRYLKNPLSLTCLLYCHLSNISSEITLTHFIWLYIVLTVDHLYIVNDGCVVLTNDWGIEINGRNVTWHACSHVKMFSWHAACSQYVFFLLLTGCQASSDSFWHLKLAQVPAPKEIP